MRASWDDLRRGPVGRRTRGATRRLRDAGELLRSGKVPERRASHSIQAEVEPEGPPLYCGWTRYSAYAQGSKAYVAARQSVDEEAYKSDLWSAARIGPREEIFLGLSLPLLQQQSRGFDYQHFITYSPEMPDPWQENLQEAVRSFDILHLHDVRRALQAEIRDHLITIGSPSRTIVWFRVDDDDLLGLTYLATLSAYATPHEHGRTISLARGYSAIWHEGVITDLRPTYRRLGSQGQAYVGRWDAQTQTLHLPRPQSHATVDRRMPTVLDSRTPTFLQLRHLGQDTATPDQTLEDLRAEVKTEPLAPDELAEAFSTFPTIREAYLPREGETKDPTVARSDGTE